MYFCARYKCCCFGSTTFGKHWQILIWFRMKIRGIVILFKMKGWQGGLVQFKGSWPGLNLAALHRPLYKVSFQRGGGEAELLTERAQAPQSPFVVPLVTSLRLWNYLNLTWLRIKGTEHYVKWKEMGSLTRLSCIYAQAEYLRESHLWWMDDLIVYVITVQLRSQIWQLMNNQERNKRPIIKTKVICVL